MAEARLDPDRVRQARQELGLSQRALGKRLGVSLTVIRDLELGRGQSGYGMSLLGRLADVLGRDIRTLLAPQGDETDSETACATVAGSDSAVLAAALMSAGRPLSRTGVAKALGWTLDRTHAAFTALRGDLAGTGLRLQTVGGCNLWAVRPADELLSERQRGGLAGAVNVAWGLKLDEARLLHRIATSRLERSEWDRRATNNDRVSLATLRKRGLITTAGEYYALTPPVAYSLGLAAKTVAPPRTRKPAGYSQRAA